ncbi:MAG: hypothetical protein SYC29_07800, partial [Planctomycetota bacterium]|nr:hypothetical protein [Planctomycetota bacterium]
MSTMTEQTHNERTAPPQRWDENDPLIRARREKLDRWRDEHDITGYGHRVDGIVSLREARAL